MRTAAQTERLAKRWIKGDGDKKKDAHTCDECGKVFQCEKNEEYENDVTVPEYIRCGCLQEIGSTPEDSMLSLLVFCSGECWDAGRLPDLLMELTTERNESTD